MDRHQEMRVFVAVVDCASLAAASRMLELSAPTVTRSVAALEQRMGARLFDRSTRGVVLTPIGERFAASCRALLAAVDEAEHNAAQLHSEPRGQLSVAAPLLFGQNFIAPILLEFIEQHPQLRAQTLFVDRMPNLHEEGIDVAVQIGDLPDSSFVAVRVGSIRRVLCAAPAYLMQRAEPTHPNDLTDHQIVASAADSRDLAWQFDIDGDLAAIHTTPRFIVSTNQGAIEAALTGGGITRAMSYQVAPQLRTGRLRLLLQSFEPPPVAVHLTYREGRHASAKVRRFIAFATERLRADPVLNTPSPRREPTAGSR